MGSDSEMPIVRDEEMSDDEDYYYFSNQGDDGDGSCGGSREDDLLAGDYEGWEAEGSDESVSRRDQRYIVLTEKDIFERQEEDMNTVSELLLISREEAGVLLHHYRWNISKLTDHWFSDEEEVRGIVGLLMNGNNFPNSRKLTCGMCSKCYSLDVMSSVGCAHFYCHECWEGYISSAVSQGPGCLLLRCPDPSCSAMVRQRIITELAKHGDKEKYERFSLCAYVEGNRNTKWCPASDCTCAVEFTSGVNYDVSCNCKFSFCWKCTEEAHKPVNCETVSKWFLKNSAESENTKWILANSKPCPNCQRLIVKHQGCMHMTCTRCKFEFCWSCLGSWAEHGERTGGFYACNRYESAKKEGAYYEVEARRGRAKNSLQRYMHYYERWASNHTSRQKAHADLIKAEKEQLAKLNDIYGIPEAQLKVIIEAWSQIIECRQVLKWTYAYGYYLEDETKSVFFEYLQGEAESGLERLHQCAEKDLQMFLTFSKHDKNTEDHSSASEFGDFLVKLADLSSVTRKYFENVVQALEAGLEDVKVTSEAAASMRMLCADALDGSKVSTDAMVHLEGSFCVV